MDASVCFWSIAWRWSGAGFCFMIQKYLGVLLIPNERWQRCIMWEEQCLFPLECRYKCFPATELLMNFLKTASSEHVESCGGGSLKLRLFSTELPFELSPWRIRCLPCISQSELSTESQCILWGWAANLCNVLHLLNRGRGWIRLDCCFMVSFRHN